MKTSKSVLFALGIAALSLASCSHHDDNPTGSWKSTAPVSVTNSIADASSATKTLNFDFNAPVNDAPGEVVLTSEYDVTLSAPADSVTSYRATATIKGTWANDGDDHDDYILTFDRNTLDVSGVDAPALGPVTDEFLNSLSQFSTIEDVEVSSDGLHLSFETDHPKAEYHFVKK